ncbi:hypothetical protein BH23GEM4_BH23GEM4_19950 [soil metagenome]
MSSPRAADELFPELPVTLEPDPALLRYYALSSLVLGPFFFVLLIPWFFRFHTLHYEVDREGITRRWGILFRREISLTYARIQDIHLSSNVVERWLGLAKVQVQTASGSSGAEMTIEGLRDFEAMRDFLYSRMRGAREPGRAAAVAGFGPAGADSAELAGVLRDIAAEVRALRDALAAPGGAAADSAAEQPGA